MTELVVFTSDDQAALIILEQPRAAVLTEIEVGLVVMHQDTQPVLVEPEVRPEVVMTGVQGPAGVMGPTGQSALPSVFYPAGETLGGHRAVWLSGGQAMYANNDDASADAVLGLTLGSAVLGAPVEIRYVGVVTEPSWAWVPGDPVYLSTDGMLTQSAPLSGALVELGVALTATSLNVRIQEAIYRG